MWEIIGFGWILINIRERLYIMRRLDIVREKKGMMGCEIILGSLYMDDWKILLVCFVWWLN